MLRCLAIHLALFTVACLRPATPPPTTTRTTAAASAPASAAPVAAPELRWGAAGKDPVIAAAGDIASQHGNPKGTADLLVDLLRVDQLAAVLALGDTAYPVGAAADFASWYLPTWGRPELRAITRAVPGNHEYVAPPGDASAFFDFFNGPGVVEGPAGKRGEGWYGFDVGAWHVIALNTNYDCKRVPCGAGSAQARWLATELRAHPSRCTLAFFHAPRFQQGRLHRDFEGAAALWSILYDGGADLVLAGHEHNYQQLGPLDRDGRRDDARGIRSFVVGTGGAPLYNTPLEFASTHEDVMEAKDGAHFGVLELALHPDSYDWRFVSTERQVLFAGGGRCH